MYRVEFQTTKFEPNLVDGVIESLIEPVQPIEDNYIHEFYFFGKKENSVMTLQVRRTGKMTQFIGPPDTSAPREMVLEIGQRVTFADLTKEITFWLAEVPQSRKTELYDYQFKPKE